MFNFTTISMIVPIKKSGTILDLLFIILFTIWLCILGHDTDTFYKQSHNVCNYIDGLNTEQNQHLKMGSDLVMNMEEDVAKENEDEDCDMMMGDDHEEATDDADFEGPQESGQDLPYSGGQNVVSIHLIP